MDKNWVITRDDARIRLMDWCNYTQLMVSAINHLTVQMMESANWDEFQANMDNYLRYVQEPVKSEIKNLIVAFLFGVTVEVGGIDNAEGNTGHG